MLLNLHKKSWMDGLRLHDFSEHCNTNEKVVKEMLQLAKNYNKVGCPNRKNPMFPMSAWWPVVPRTFIKVTAVESELSFPKTITIECEILPSLAW